ncbi:MAG: hypothetical protein ACT4PJ_08340 [Gemmatimonadaceae bacterium]
MTTLGPELYPALFVLHQHLAGGDRTLGEAVARLAYRPLIAQLEREFRDTDEHIICQEAGTAVLAYLKAPERCTAISGADVFKFLCVIARRRLANYHRNERTRARLEGEYAQSTRICVGGSVREGEPPTDAKEVVELSTPDVRVEQEEEASLTGHRRQAVMGSLESEVDRQVLALRLEGVRTTKAYADVLGIADFPITEQRRIVKQHKDRIDKIIRRARAKSERFMSDSAHEETNS